MGLIMRGPFSGVAPPSGPIQLLDQNVSFINTTSCLADFRIDGDGFFYARHLDPVTKSVVTEPIHQWNTGPFVPLWVRATLISGNLWPDSDDVGVWESIDSPTDDWAWQQHRWVDGVDSGQILLELSTTPDGSDIIASCTINISATTTGQVITPPTINLVGASDGIVSFRLNNNGSAGAFDGSGGIAVPNWWSATPDDTGTEYEARIAEMLEGASPPWPGAVGTWETIDGLGGNKQWVKPESSIVVGDFSMRYEIRHFLSDFLGIPPLASWIVNVTLT